MLCRCPRLKAVRLLVHVLDLKLFEAPPPAWTLCRSVGFRVGVDVGTPPHRYHGQFIKVFANPNNALCLRPFNDEPWGDVIREDSPRLTILSAQWRISCHTHTRKFFERQIKRGREGRSVSIFL